MRKLILTLVLFVVQATARDIPAGFVHYKAGDPALRGIQLSLRYAGSYNFIGTPVDGYTFGNQLVLTRETFNALLLVQKDVQRDGFSLVVYDAYRPEKAVKHFMRWSKNADDVSTKEIFYPKFNKRDLFKKGFICEKSTHTEGSTVDVTLIEKTQQVLDQPILQYRTLSNGKIVPFYYDGTVDAGSHFDYFGGLSSHSNKQISTDQQNIRKYLKKKMKARGFVHYDNEWWHFTFVQEEDPDGSQNELKGNEDTDEEKLDTADIEDENVTSDDDTEPTDS